MSRPATDSDRDLIARVATTSGLAPGVARRIVEDVLAHHGEPFEAFVVRRHRELAAAGWKNAAIFAQLQAEIGRRMFPGPQCSVRQIRRMIYG